jgi:glycerol-3-phosphate dehydrogenase
MKRADMLQRAMARTDPWDLVIVGGGATGVGVAVDAASRGYEVLLLEQSDFGKGTSSRSTKLVHGGVRYLEQGNISLVIEALSERGILRRNAPHLVNDLASSFRVTTGGKGRSTDWGSRSTTCSRAATVSGHREFCRARKRWQGFPRSRLKDCWAAWFTMTASSMTRAC